ncbi:MAG: cyclic pyranopterin monophosphate synthase MoaC [Dehalococcoidia bacterium]|jgi:cyclic pyranopterin phosphate synthase|nr:MAG: cyclic pyranopterin monophosphate synthase MoaC [Dehalococcoidia bacterium]TEU19018.1 MAG: cyclic pyranopterin monophosphate synthase MoaC [Dehalococcoidia bacterium]
MELGPIHMIDVTQKKETERQAVAKGKVQMKPATLGLIRKGELEKGDVLAVAKTAGIMAAKETHRLIPLCHPLDLTHIAVEFHMPENGNSIEITASAKGIGKTGFEMEALVAVSVSALTIYDMCKAVDRSMTIGEIRLIRKSGGKSGLYLAD